MKKLIPLLALLTPLAGCGSVDKSGDTQTMAPTGGAEKTSAAVAGNPNIPANVKGQIPTK